ncbi:hypothetical protein [Brevibacillus laterosporus]|uniref:hypothetical protein n=1 Tax=Brevibacillus laterosporus TaxID=1465 RepID=UPI00158626E6|nr:hypothetical protein [Brevibacillus laterosporus]
MQKARDRMLEALYDYSVMSVYQLQTVLVYTEMTIYGYSVFSWGAVDAALFYL